MAFSKFCFKLQKISKEAHNILKLISEFEEFILKIFCLQAVSMTSNWNCIIWRRATFGRFLKTDANVQSQKKNDLYKQTINNFWA